MFFNPPDSPVDLFFRAVNEGNASRCAELIAEGVSPDTRGYDERTALHMVALEGRVSVAEALLKAGADVNALDKGANTPLHLAAYRDHGPMCTLLTMHGAHLNTQDGSMERRTPLHVAVNQGGESAMNALLKAGADVHGLDRENVRPFDRLYHGVKLETLQNFIDAGAPMKAGENYNHYVLKNMIEFNHVQQALFLIANGAPVPAWSKKIRDIDPTTLTPKTAAARGGLISTLIDLLEKEPEPKSRKDLPSNLCALARRHAGAESEMMLRAHFAKKAMLEIQKKAAEAARAHMQGA